MKRLDLRIDGMDCAEEIAALAPLPGIQQVDFNLLERRMSVHYATVQVQADAIIEAVNRTGLRASPFREGADDAGDGSGWRWVRTLMTALSGVLLLAAFLAHVVAAGWTAALGEHNASAVPVVVVNDAPALARASVGIAMGAVGTDAAIETADIALMSDDLSRVPWLIRHSRRALRIVRQNIVASLAIKAVFVVLTLFGYASLWAAIAADMGVSLLVVANALRLLSDVSLSGSRTHA